MITWFFIPLGLYFIYSGFTAEYFVDETEGFADDEGRGKFKATPFKRALFVTLGLILAGFGIWNLVLHGH